MKKSYFGAIVVFTLMLFVGCGKKEEEKLKICVNSTNQAAINILVGEWQELEEGSEVELIVLPTDKDEAEMKLSELRTEVMAGKGPDIFLLECVWPEYEESDNGLFVDLEKTMETGLFLPLDEYIKNAKYIDTSGWNQTVLDAGKTEEGQVVLPLYYYLPAYVFESSNLSEQEVPGSWEELMTSENPVLKNAVKEQMFSYFTYSFGNLADYQAGTLTFSEEELKGYMEEFLTFEIAVNAQEDMQSLPEPIAGGWTSGEFFYSGVGRAAGEELTYVSIPNREGSVTAMVTMFAALNKNTTRAEEAFSFLDYILRDEVTSGSGFMIEDKHYGGGIDLNPDPSGEGITVNQKVFEESYCKNDKVKTAFETLNDRIECVRFYSVLDRDLSNLRDDVRVMSYTSEDTSYIGDLVKTTYETMKMRIAE